MRQTHKKRLVSLTALLLTLSLVLGGCSAPVEKSAALEEEPEQSVELPAEPGESGTTEEPGETANVPPEGSEQPPATGLAARTGLEAVETMPLSQDEARQIRRAVAGMRASYVAGPNGDDSIVKARDWSVYSSPLGKMNMTAREAAFYDDIGDFLQKYLSTSALSGVKRGNYYVTDGIRFSGRGLSKDQASAVLSWFLYNNPQYYFISPATFSDSDSLYPCIYKTMIDGEKRAEITNDLFDRLESWVDTVEAQGGSTYQRELAANNLICESVVYKEERIDNLRVDQSLYSAVVMESTVCAGYSKVFCAMMNAMGVAATAGLSTGHAWNVVRFDDGNYYAVDVCWNDTDEPGRPYDNRYLNVGEADSKINDDDRESHTYEDDYIAWIPAIAQVSYTPPAEGPQETVPENAPPSPANAGTAAVEETKAVTSWDLVLGADGYEVCYFADSTCTEVSKSFPMGPEDDHVRWKNMSEGRTYYFGVRSFKTVDGQQVYSAWSSHSYTHQWTP